MKTLVFFSIPGSVLSLESSDFPTGGPFEGRSYEFDGKLYRVVELVESLGCRAAMGNKISTDARLLQFAEAVCRGEDELKQQIMKARKVGSNAPEDERSAGGIIIPASESGESDLHSSYEHLLFARAVPVDVRGELRLPRPLRLTQAEPSEPGSVSAEADAGS